MKSARDTVAGLDIGTTKTCAVVATVTRDGLDIIGVGEAPSTGLRRGVVTDLEETVRSIEAATERAERMAGVHISHVYVGVTGEHVQSTNNRGVVAISSDEREVAANDVRRCLEASKLITIATDRQIIHALPRAFSVDGHEGVSDPVGLSGGRLEVETHIITGGTTFITNVLKCVHRAGLEPAGIVFEPLASGAATLLNEEKQVGVALLDIGGGTTDVIVYSDGGVAHSSTVPVGGNILTNDIALGLKTTFADAEAVKRAHGTGADEGDGDPGFPVHTLDGRTQRMVTRAQLRAIVVPRMLEIFRMAKTHISEHTPRDLVLAEVVLTGGGAHLRGIEALATECFGVPVRIGVPTAVGGLMDAVRQPQYATAVGLVLFGPRGDGAVPNGRRRGKNPFSRMAAWLGDVWS
ncbi:MAG TPA: cell division protein FtsA [Candidatus Acidoferrales bacterium]|nr:cell division protein FtsA [Candidatus Acidoferrales bacterium]